MKAIVITRNFNDLSNENKFILNTTNTFKICVNTVKCKCNIRLFHDYACYKYYINNFNEQLITSKNGKIFVEKINALHRFDLFYQSVKEINTDNSNELYFKTASIVPSIDYCIKNGYNQVLLIANNRVYHDLFQSTVKECIDDMAQHVNIYQFTDGNFNVPVVSIKDFINNKYL